MLRFSPLAFGVSFLGFWLAALLAAPGCGSRTEDTLRKRSSEGPHFRDVAAETGLDFQHFIGATGEYFIPEIIGAGVALFDYDGDGDLDIYLLQGSLLDKSKRLEDAKFRPPQNDWPGNRLYRNELIPEGALRFTDVTEEAGVGHEGYGMGAAVGDYDGDGRLDLYVTTFGSNVLFRNNGNGSFTDVTREAGADDPRWSTSAAFLDYDNDNDLDLFVANYLDFDLTRNKVCRDPTGARDYCDPSVYQPTPDRLFRNDGRGRFSDVTRQVGMQAAFGSGLGVTCADFNADGWTDVYVANDGNANQLWISKAGGSFEDVALMSGTAYNADGVAEAGMGVTAGDFDGDGDDDLFMTHLAKETNTLYLNDGRANFQDATSRFGLANVSFPYTGFGTAWFDYDNDGFLDLFAANGAVTIVESLRGSPYPFHQPNQLFHNEQGKGFRDVTAEAGPGLQMSEVSRGAAFGDIDNDGDMDIVVSNNNGPVRLLMNEASSRPHWLQVSLKSSGSNGEGIGAKVRVLRQGETPLVRRAHRDGSYLSASDVRVHFGLGEKADLEGVIVDWPGGPSEFWPNVQADTVVTLDKGSGRPWRAE